MTPQSELEIKGSFYQHPFVELLVEAAHAGLSGSLRVADKEKKCVIYFKDGRVVFAVSNSRSTRLFDALLRRGTITKDDLVKIPNFSNDFELTKFLIEKSLLTKADSDRLFEDQIIGIITDILTWTDAEWNLSPLARIREDLFFEIDLSSHLLNYSRTLSNDAVLSRFRSLDETFRRSAVSEMAASLTPEEGFILSRADDGQLSASDLVSLSAMPDAVVLKTLYTLWIGGFLIRDNWNPALSRGFIAALKLAKFELKAVAKIRETPTPPDGKTNGDAMDIVETASEAAPKEADVALTLEEYLVRMERSDTYYDILGVDSKAEADELKRAYFFLAKNFHPDRYHSEGGDLLKRIQNAFTELAQAHETLKNADSREVYDYRMRKQIAEREKRQESGETDAPDIRIEQAAENFDRGFDLLMDEETDAAVPFLARAAHFAPQNARYRAYFGKVLSFNDKQRHKAEGELQTAVKLEPNNPSYRIMLAEFFIDFNLVKRAEGELNRLLAIFPNHRDARELLESLKVNS